MAKKWGKCDFDDLKKFQKKLERLQQANFEKFCEDAAKELAARLLAMVIKRTPTGVKPGYVNEAVLKEYWSGYVGGELKRGWTSKTAEEAKNKGGHNDVIAFARSLPITKQGDMYQIEIINPVEYASYVEYGHRQEPGKYVPALGKQLKRGWVPGKFMLTISEQELNAQLPGLLEKKLLIFLKGALFDD